MVRVLSGMGIEWHGHLVEGVFEEKEDNFGGLGLGSVGLGLERRAEG